jgi:hypothetical protein
MSEIAISSPYVRARVLIDGGLLWRPEFLLGDSQWVTPLAEAPWAEDPAIQRDQSLPPYIRKLGGAFLGLPFGGRGVPPGLLGWHETPATPPHHGICASAIWSAKQIGSDRVDLVLEPGPENPLSRIEQTIRCAPDCAKISVIVSAMARSDLRLPLGYHPVLRLPEFPAKIRVNANFERGHVFPYALNPLGRAKPSATFFGLEDVPGEATERLDFSSLPHGRATEELLLLTRVAGPIDTHFDDSGFVLRLDWDRATLPNCLMWLHDGATKSHPWGGSFRGLGVEPCASAFDFSGSDDPLAKGGDTTAVEFRADEPRTFQFSLEVQRANSERVA